MFTPGSAKVAVCAATARSHIETSWQPAAVAMPWTRAITGCGSVVSLVNVRLHAAKSSRCHAASACARSSFRSCPAQNPRPAAASTTTRTPRSDAMRSSSASSAASIGRDSALKRSPRLSVTVQTPATVDERT